LSPATGKSYEPLTPKHFSFNAPAGACRVCHGLGQKMVFDADLIVPDQEKSIEQGAVLPWRRGGKRMISYYKALLKGVAAHGESSKLQAPNSKETPTSNVQHPTSKEAPSSKLQISKPEQEGNKLMDAPYKNLPEHFRKLLLQGSGDTEIQFTFWRAGKISKVSKPFEGVIPNLERLYQESESEFTRNRLKAFMAPQFCDACRGKRLKPEILAVRLGDAENSKLQTQTPGRNPIPNLKFQI